MPVGYPRLTLALMFLLALVELRCEPQPRQEKPIASKPLALIGATILTAPSAPPIVDGVIIVEHGKIAAVGPGSAISIPSRADILDVRGHTVVAGFWNCHVHFIEPKWSDAAQQPSAQLAANLAQMLTSQGFTSVVDTGSLLANTLDLRRRIESGEVPGPRILTAGLPLYPKDGVPYYVSETLPPEVVKLLPTPATADEAVRAVDVDVAAGADLIKLFLVTGVRVDGRIVLKSMDPAIVRAAVSEAHRLGKPVAAHPSTITGLELALTGHVDILAHTIQDPENWTSAVVSRLAAAHVALVPTLALFGPMDNSRRIVEEVKSYAAAGGRIIFGTDVGFLSDYSALKREFVLLSEAGLTLPQLLETLTIAPARQFGREAHSGCIAVGADADLVVLKGTPPDGTRILTQVSYTLRAGQIIYTATE